MYMESVFIQGSNFLFKRLLLPLLLLSGLACAQGPADSLHAEDRAARLMGSAFIFKAIHPDKENCIRAINLAIREVRRIEALISSWQESSQTTLVNNHAGIRPVKVDWELFRLIQRSLKVSTLSEGSFDITFASADRIWRFDGSMKAMPAPEEVAASVAKIDFRKIILNPEDTTVYLPEKGMKIGFGGIGKGYAANRAKAVMEKMGIQNGLVNAGGDLICWGKNLGGKDWHIGITDPLDKSKMIAWLVINDLAVVTSGDYERYTLIDGRRFAHIIDPKSGYPVQGVASVSIFCPDTELADALATAVFVMGPEKGIQLLERLRGIEGMLVDHEGRIFSSKGLNLQYYSENTLPGTPVKKIGTSNE